MKDFSSFQCPWVDKSTICQKADVFRDTHWKGNPLPIDMESIIEAKLGLDVVPERDMLRDYDIDAYLKRDLTGVVVDYRCYMDERYSNRLRFSYAHEIGHLDLHKDKYSELDIESPQEWQESICQMTDKDYGHFEYQANEFAGRLLVPKEILIEELGKHIQGVIDVGLGDYLKSQPDTVLARISPSLCKPFGVSDQVISRRVEREGLWPPAA